MASWIHASQEVPSRQLYERQVRSGVLVKGTPGFQKAICDALDLLQQMAPTRFSFVVERIAAVGEGNDVGGGRASLSPPFFVFCQGTASNFTWCAAGLVHEAMHVE